MQTLELVAEVAVLEEEVVRLEEQVTDYKQGLFQEATYTSSRRSLDTSSIPAFTSLNEKHSGSLSLSEVNSDTSSKAESLPPLSRTASRRKLLPSDPVPDQGKRCFSGPLNDRQPLKRSNAFSKDELGKENRRCANDEQSLEKNSQTVQTPGKRPLVKPKSVEKCVDSPGKQVYASLELWFTDFTYESAAIVTF